MIKWPAPNVVCYDVTDKVLFKTLASLWYMIEDIFLLIKIGPSVSRWNKSRESGQLIGKNNHNQTTSRREEIAASSKDKGRWMWPVDGPWNRRKKGTFGRRRRRPAYEKSSRFGYGRDRPPFFSVNGLLTRIIKSADI